MIQSIVRNYFRALQENNYANIMRLFTKNAVVYSPLRGKVRAAKFYKQLFKDTTKSKIALVEIFTTKNVGAAYFIYIWTLRNGKKVSFECIDLFYTSRGKIKQLKIIYDTYKIRNKI